MEYPEFRGILESAMDRETRLDIQSKLEATLLALEAALGDGRPEAFLSVEAGLKTALARLREMETDVETSELTGFRIAFGEGLDPCSYAGIGAVYDPTLVSLAMALDDCSDMITEGLGLYGSHGFGGAWVEACYDEDPLDEHVKVERVNALGDLPELEFGDWFEAKWFSDRQRNSTIRVRNNRISCSTYYIDQLLPRNRRLNKQHHPDEHTS
jgi:hypothetical protein